MNLNKLTMALEQESIIFNAAKNVMFGIELVFIDYMNYFNTIDKVLLDNIHSFELEIFTNKKAYVNKIKEDSHQYQDELLYLEQNIAGNYCELAITYPNYFRSFFLTQLYAFIENELKILCKYDMGLNRRNDLKKIFNDKRSELEKLRNYLFEVCRLDENLFKDDFEFLERARKVRNKIIHTNGSVRAKDKEFQYFRDISDNSEIIQLEKKQNGDYLILLKNSELIESLSKAGERIFINLLMTPDVDFCRLKNKDKLI
jgi:hypothetical protein